MKKWQKVLLGSAGLLVAGSLLVVLDYLWLDHSW